MDTKVDRFGHTVVHYSKLPPRFSLFFGLLYLLFYLCFLDANGVHFYVILNPRTNVSVCSYFGIMVLYLGVFLWWK